MIEYLSSSQMNLFLQCSLKYKFRYIDKIPTLFKSSGLALGSAVHTALSWFHKERMNGRKVVLEDFLRIFDTDWYCQKDDTHIRYKAGEQEMNLVVVAKELLALYFQQKHNGIKGAEVPFSVPLIDPSNGKELGLNLDGFMDLIEDDDTIVEFKTSNQAMNQKDLNENLQLTAYSYAYQFLHQKPPKLIKVVDLVKTKKPKIIILKTKREKKDYQRFFALAIQILRGIQYRLFFPRQSFMCKDCEYAVQCRDWEVDS